MVVMAACAPGPKLQRFREGGTGNARDGPPFVVLSVFFGAGSPGHSGRNSRWAQSRGLDAVADA